MSKDALILAVGATEDGRFAEAQALCRQILEADRENAKAWMLHARLLAREDAWSQAIEAFGRANALGPNDLAWRLDFVGACRVAMRLDDAVLLCLDVLKIHPPRGRRPDRDSADLRRPWRAGSSAAPPCVGAGA